MHLGVQRLDPAVHHLGKAGVVGYVLYRKPRLAQRFGGAARGQQFHPVPRKRLPQRHKPRLVGHRKQRPRNPNPAHFLAFRLSSPPEGPGDRPAARHDHAADHHLPARLYGSFAVDPKTIVKTERTAAAAERKHTRLNSSTYSATRM